MEVGLGLASQMSMGLKTDLTDKHPGSPLSEATGKALALVSKPHLTQQFGTLSGSSWVAWQPTLSQPDTQ